MCKPEAVALLQYLFHGSMNVVEYIPPARNQYAWQVVAKEAQLCAEHLLPFLRIKKQQALHLIELQEINRQVRQDTTVQRSQRGGTYGHFGKYQINPVLKDRAEELHRLNKELNARGAIALRIAEAG
jgi:hypothetical protein